MVTYNIEMMQEFAKSKGGKCLSNFYKNGSTLMKWQCKMGHVWENKYRNMKKGSWCPICRKIRLGQTIEKMQVLAKKNGGECLSKQYITGTTKLKWKCKKSHIWETTPENIKNGYWCPQCFRERRRLTIEQMQQLAKDHQGKCLSEKYVNRITELLWECKQGHVWKAKPSNIINGKWCPKCSSINRGHPIEFYQQYAESKKGHCLTKKITFKTQDLLFICSKGHKWKTNRHQIHIGHWCPTCGAEKENYTIKDMKIIAQKRNGRCLSPISSINGHSILKWECELNHKWEASVFAIIMGWWCPECRKSKPQGELLELSTIKDMRDIAQFHGGKCLSSSYINRHTKLRWKCAKGHEWLAAPGGIVSSNSWCPHCSKSAPKNIEEMQKLAQSREGRCLSIEYINIRTKLCWQCKNGHIWYTRPTNIVEGNWCPECATKNRSLDIEEMQQLAEIKGGKCLSLVYKNSYTKLKWQCAKGHVWETTPSLIKQGNWCPKCGFDKKRKTMEDMHKFAKEKGGLCLSDTYLGVLTPLKWQCAEGHVWETAPTNIQKGSWCPDCGNRVRALSLEKMQQFANSRGGKCLSLVYKNTTSKLRWQCAKGHIWDSPYKKFNKGSWCPECNPLKKKTIKDAQFLARKKNGFCISTEYKNSKTIMQWKCEKGHIWSTTYNQIQRGSWCPLCGWFKKTMKK